MRRRIWRGYDDPGLPSGMWYGWVQGTGDVSGGSIILDVTLEPAEAGPVVPGLSGVHYSLENIVVQSTFNSTTNGILRLINLTPPEAGALYTKQYTVGYSANEPGDAAMLIGTQLLQRPLFLGSRQLVSTVAALRFEVDNTDAEVIVFWAEGYLWEARSISAPGGLRRPVDSLYG